MNPSLTVAERGCRRSSEAMFNDLYNELHRLAQRELARRGANFSLGVTTLLHEVFLGIAGGPSFPDRAQFMAYSARVMRGLIIDHVRSRCAQKRGGQVEITSLDTSVAENVRDPEELTQIGEALDQLAQIDSSLAEVVDLKFFCGFSFAEIAAMWDVSERTVQRNWEKARIYLRRSIRGQSSPVPV